MPITVEQLAKYRPGHRILIETGTCTGEGVLRGLTAGFEEVRSVELSDHWYKSTLDRFSGNREVRLYHGLTEEILPFMIAGLTEPLTFWLDGHYAGPGTAKGPKSCPLLQELEIIGRHRVKTHTILVDDLRCWTREDSEIGFGLTEIIAAVLTINPNYQIEYIDGEVPGDILAARFP